VSAFGFGTTVSCRDGYSYGETGSYFPFGLDRSGETAYRISDTRHLVVTRTVRGRERATLSIRFYSDGGRYLVRGRMTIRSTLRRRGKRTRCSASRPFTGAFATGPAA
jgi:hypothetical protein